MNFAGGNLSSEEGEQLWIIWENVCFLDSLTVSVSYDDIFETLGFGVEERKKVKVFLVLE